MQKKQREIVPTEIPSDKKIVAKKSRVMTADKVGTHLLKDKKQRPATAKKGPVTAAKQPILKTDEK